MCKENAGERAARQMQGRWVASHARAAQERQEVAEGVRCGHCYQIRAESGCAGDLCVLREDYRPEDMPVTHDGGPDVKDGASCGEVWG